MLNYLFRYSNYQMRDYERKLALLELQSIRGDNRLRRDKDKIMIVARNRLSREKLEDLTFFSEVVLRNGKGDLTIIPRQVKYELSAKILKSNIEENNQKEIYELIINGKSNSRQLRYLTHLMHEYKGRYNPQLCKALINIANLKKSALILDPFVGSGTTLIECLLNGYNGIGLDLNPLSYLITKVKVESLALDIKSLKAYTEDLIRVLQHKENQEINNKTLESLYSKIAFQAPTDLDYLKKWFPLRNLIQIFTIILEIFKFTNERIRNLFFLALSDILIDLSYQDPGQLRIKRRSEEEVKKEVYQVYFSKIRYYCNIISTYQLVKPLQWKNEIRNYLGDTRNLRKVLGLSDDSVDLIVTSPPYATALPYIDTDRLSLMLFGYINKDSLRQLESRMIGNREITQTERERLEEELVQDKIIPRSIKLLIMKIYKLNKYSSVGFRRKNTAALLYKYFSDMYQSMLEMHKVLKKNKYCLMVVGCNSTRAGERDIFIPTDDFIGDIGESTGFRLKTKLCLNIQPSYMIHKKNAIRRESVLFFIKG